MKIWAHRGCSQNYPENTLLAFSKAAEIEGLTGIELDIQLTKDGEMVVFHDEKLNRTTNGVGELRTFTLAELKRLRIDAGDGKYERIPTIEEVFDLLEDRVRNGLKVNIELKNNIFPYDGMEEKIVDLVYKRGIQNRIVYSSFNVASIERIKYLDGNAEIGILDKKISDCVRKMRYGYKVDALHPYWKEIDLPVDKLRGYTVRAWFSGHLYPERPTGTKLDLEILEKQGITDVFLNEPERYL